MVRLERVNAINTLYLAEIVANESFASTITHAQFTFNSQSLIH